MRETDQTIFEEGKGNCFAACVASILEIPVSEVVHFSDGECAEWRDVVNEWLSSRSLFFLDISLPGDMRDSVVKYWGYHIIMGDSPRVGDIRHAVVGYKGDIVFDPHPSRDGLKGNDWTYGLLIGRK